MPLETGGHRSTGRVPERVVTILDVKCPGSGEAHRNDWSNLDRLRPHDQVKFVVCDRADYEWARGVVLERALHDYHSVSESRTPDYETLLALDSWARRTVHALAGTAPLSATGA